MSAQVVRLLERVIGDTEPVDYFLSPLLVLMRSHTENIVSDREDGVAVHYERTAQKCLS